MQYIIFHRPNLLPNKTDRMNLTYKSYIIKMTYRTRHKLLLFLSLYAIQLFYDNLVSASFVEETKIIIINTATIIT